VVSSIQRRRPGHHGPNAPGPCVCRPGRKCPGWSPEGDGVVTKPSKPQNAGQVAGQNQPSSLLATRPRFIVSSVHPRQPVTSKSVDLLWQNLGIRESVPFWSLEQGLRQNAIFPLSGRGPLFFSRDLPTPPSTSKRSPATVDPGAKRQTLSGGKGKSCIYIWTSQLLGKQQINL